MPDPADNGSKPEFVRRRPKRILTEQEWHRIRSHYETDPGQISLRAIADFYGVGRQTVMIRAARDKWRRRDHITTIARRATEQAMDNQNLVEVATPIIQELAKKSFEDMAPWIEKKKRSHIRNLVNLGNQGITRVRKLMKSQDPTDAKTEAFTAKTAETWNGIIRGNLGMNDSNALSGQLSVRVLTEGAAIEVQSS